MISKNQRLAISYTRIMAVLLILNCHILQAIESKWAWVLNVGVQIFFSMSGFLHAEKYKKNFTLFAWSKFKKIYIPYITVFSWVLLAYMLFQKDLIDIHKILGHILAIHAFTGTLKGLGHLWFISVILICYLLTPIVEKLNKKFGFYFWSIMAIISFLWFSNISYYYDYCLWIMVYFFGYFARLYIDRLKSIIIIASLALIILLPDYQIHSADSIDSWTHAIGGSWIFFSTLYFFKFIKKVKKIKILELIDSYSYEIYLTHLFFIIGPFSLIKVTNYLAANLLLVVFAIIVASYLLKHTSMCIIKNIQLNKLVD